MIVDAEYQTKLIITPALIACTLFIWCYSSRRKKYPDGTYKIPHLHSWIPYIGSGMELQRGHIRDFISSTASKLNAPAFTATIMGDKCLYIADSGLLPFIFRDSRQLDNLTFQKRFSKNVLGFSEKIVELQFSPSKAESVKDVMNIFHTHLLGEQPLEKSIRRAQEIMINDMKRVPNSQETKRSALFQFTSTAVFRASAGALLSNSFLNNDQEIMLIFRKFEKDVGLIFAGAPNWMVRDGKTAFEALRELFDSPETRKSESEFLQARRSSIRQSWGDAADADNMVAVFNIGVLLASVSNSVQSIFWVIFHLLEDVHGYEACYQAVKKVAERREKGREYFTLEELDELSILQSAFNESLRRYQALFVTREAVQDFTLNPKETNGPKYKVEKGTLIQVYPNTMHMDPDIFVHPEQFRYDRFLNPKAETPSGSLLSSHLRPFGGGKHMCPGRKFISYEARAFLALLLLKYDMKLVPGETCPGIDFSRQGLAVCAADRDVQVEMRERI